MKMVVFWDVTPYDLVDIYRHFRGDYCFHNQINVPDYMAQHSKRQPCLQYKFLKIKHSAKYFERSEQFLECSIARILVIYSHLD
jgi:hypothetical protein